MQNFFPNLHLAQGLPQPSIYNPSYSNFLPLLPNYNQLAQVQSLQSNLHKRVNPYADLPMNLAAVNVEKRLHIGNPSGFQPCLNLNLKNSLTPAVEVKSAKVGLQKCKKLAQQSEFETQTSAKVLDADSLSMKDNILNKLLISNLGRDMMMPVARPMEMMFNQHPNYPFGNMNQQQVFNFPVRSFTPNGFYGHQSFQPPLFTQQQQQGNNHFIPQQQFQTYASNPSLLNFTANHQNHSSINQSFVPKKTPVIVKAQKPALIVIEDSSENDEAQEEAEEVFCSVTIDICKYDDVFDEEEDEDEDEKEVKMRKNSDSQIECFKESSDCPTDFIESPKLTQDKIKNTNFSPIKPEGSFDHAIQILKTASESKRTGLVASHSHFRVKVEESHYEDDGDESDDEPWLFITPVGEEYQVSVVPDLELDIPISENPRRRTPKLKWNPESLTKDERDQYYLSLNKLVRKEITNEEVALGSLKMCDMDFGKTLNLVKQNRLEYRDLFAAKPKIF